MSDQSDTLDGTWLRLPEAARALGVSESAAYRYAKQGRLKRRSTRRGRRRDEVFVPLTGIVAPLSDAQCICLTYVYIFQRANGLCKIGRTSDVTARQRDIEGHSGERVDIVGLVAPRDASHLERRLHEEFGKKRTVGEWFALNDDELAYAIVLTQAEPRALHQEGCVGVTDESDNIDSTADDIVSPADLPPGEWLPPSVAATRLGVSERTVWRMIKAGRYHRRVQRGRVDVFLPLSDQSDNGSSGDTSLVPAEARDESDKPDTLALAIIEELRRRDTAQTESLTRQADRIAALERENGQLETHADSLADALGEACHARLKAEAEAKELRAEIDRLKARSLWDWLRGR